MNIERIELELGVKVREVVQIKTNGIKKYGLCLIKSGVNIAPTIYKIDGMSDTEFEDYVIQNYEELANPNFSLDSINSRDGILNNVFPALVNTKLNEEMLEKWVHKQFHDLSIIYKVNVGGGTATVTPEMLTTYKISEEELYRAALSNSDPVIKDMADLMAEFGYPDSAPRGYSYVITNAEKSYGAGSILSLPLLKNLHKKWGDFFILPSSVHEVICMPWAMCEGVTIGDLKALVSDVNINEVEDTDKLSDSVYFFNGIEVVCYE